MGDYSIRGGHSGMLGITFIGDHYSVEAKYAVHDDKGSIDINHRKLANNPVTRTMDFLEDIPFIRGPFIIFRMMWSQMRASKLYTALILYMLFGPMLIGYIADYFNLRGTSHPTFDEIFKWVCYIGLPLCVIVLFWATQGLWRLHGAEHMVMNALKNDDLNLKVDNLRKYSRFSMNCGSVFGIIFVAIYVGLLFITMEYPLTFMVITDSLAFEIFRKKSISRLFLPIAWPIQYLLLTRKPHDEDLIVASMAMYFLLHLEEKDQLPTEIPPLIGQVTDIT